jgi:hypothetical protein
MPRGKEKLRNLVRYIAVPGEMKLDESSYYYCHVSLFVGATDVLAARRTIRLQLEDASRTPAKNLELWLYDTMGRPIDAVVIPRLERHASFIAQLHRTDPEKDYSTEVRVVATHASNDDDESVKIAVVP